MDDRVATVLRTLIQRVGRELASDERRCRAFLADLCGDRPGEIFVLTTAQKQDVRVAQELEQTAAAGGALDLLLRERLVARLIGRRLDRTASDWAVRTWAEALGVPTVDSRGPRRSRRRPALRPIVRLATVDQRFVLPGDQVRLSWVVEDADHVVITGIGEQPSTGDSLVRIDDAVDFVLEARNASGSTHARFPSISIVTVPKFADLEISFVAPLVSMNERGPSFAALGGRIELPPPAWAAAFFSEPRSLTSLLRQTANGT